MELDEILFRVSAAFYGAFLGVLIWTAAAMVIDWGNVAKGDLVKFWPSFLGRKDPRILHGTRTA